MITLEPVDGRKSFYGKAAIVNENGVAVCYSYNTPVAAFTLGKFYRLWGGYSATTMRHVDSFSVRMMGKRMGKKDWDALEVVSIEDVRKELAEWAKVA